MSPDCHEELSRLFREWEVEGVVPLHALIAGVKLLLAGHPGDLTKNQRQILELIYDKGLWALEAWHVPSDYMHFCYGVLREGTALQLSEIISNAVLHLKNLVQLEQITVDVPAELPPVKAYTHLERVFVYLLTAEPLRFYLKDDPPTITAYLSDSATVTVYIQIKKGFTSSLTAEPGRLFFPGSRASVARLIVRQHGSELQAKSIDGERGEFQFTLPVWSEREPF